MVRNIRHQSAVGLLADSRFNKIFDSLVPTDRMIFRSCGLIPVANFMQRCGLTDLMSRRLRDSRHKRKVQFPLTDIITQIILQLIDGNKRISQFAQSPNVSLFKEWFGGRCPHPTAILRALKANKFLHMILAKILLRYSMNTLTEHCRKTGEIGRASCRERVWRYV